MRALRRLLSVLMVFAITAQMGLTVSAEPAAEESAAGAEAPADEEDVVLDESVVDQLTDGTQDPFDYTDDRARSALLRSADALPDSLDLRDVDGKSYVTPVKSQAPFGTCWSFAAVASAEGSVLAAGLKGSDGNTASADTLDLSEKQLAYFSASALNDPTNSQNGEGQSVEDFITTEQLMDRGGNAIIATSVFAQGIGPDHESTTDYFEYRGKNAYIESEEIDGVVQKYCYSDDDDWSIPEEFRFCSAYSLRESKILPAPAGRDEKGFYKYNEAGTAAIKRELSAHRSVLVCFCADASLPTTEPGSSQYISANWAHYTYEPLSPSHAVTIVGWDDHYPRDNFLHGEVHYDTQDGPVVFDKTPPADGAWLVKNSWGAGTEVFPNKGAGKWGIENAEGIHTGYFWISYYDQSLLSAGSFIFEEGDSDDIITQQYDYMPEILAMGARTQDETRMGNVFCARESMKLEAVSGFTTYPGTEVTYEVYLLDDQHSIGPDRGIKAAEKTVTYEFGGFHRENIDQENLLIDTSGVGKGLYIMKNQMYAVVVTQRLPGGDYVVNFQAAGKNEGGGVQSMKGIINGEESYIFMNGNWRDYGDNPSIREDLMNAVNRSDFPIDETNFNFDSLTFDNFPIKAYGRKLGTDAYMELSFSKRVYYGWDDERALLSFYSSQTDISDYDINRESISWHLEDGSKEDEKIRLSDDPARFTRQIITAKEAAENEYMYVTVNGLGTVVGLISAGRLALGFDMFLPNDENGKQKFFYDYTGDPVEPEASIYSANVKRLLTRGEHFDLSYENNIKCGAATVTATAKGVMRPGQVSLPFMILPPKAKIKDVTVSGNSMTVLVEDQSSTGTEGYRFRYRKKGSGEWTEVSGTAGSTSVTIDGLASGEQYEVCAGGYVTVPEDKRSAQIRESVYYGQDSDTVLSGRIPEGLAGKEVSLSAASYTYNGKVHIPSVESIGGLTLKEGTDYTLEVTDSSGAALSSPKAAGNYTITITGKGNYTGKTSADYTIKKAANPLRIKAGTVTLKYSELKDRKQTLERTRVVKTVRKGKGTITYTKARGNGNITINMKSGKVTVGKGLKKGVYRVKVWVNAKGSSNYKAGRRGTIFTIKVK